jgi:hypothetical protein
VPGSLVEAILVVVILVAVILVAVTPVVVILVAVILVAVTPVVDNQEGIRPKATMAGVMAETLRIQAVIMEKASRTIKALEPNHRPTRSKTEVMRAKMVVNTRDAD